MPRSHRNRWYQYKLSTWFVLVAIAAWAMLEWPWLITRQVHLPQKGIGFSSGQLADAATIEWFIIEERRSPNPALVFPVLTLAAFIGWKATWAIVDRRWRRTDHEKVNQCFVSRI